MLRFLLFPLLLLWPLLTRPRSKRVWAIALAAVAVPFAYLFYHHTGVGWCVQGRYWSEAMPAFILLIVVAMAELRKPARSLCQALAIPSPGRTARTGCWLFALFLTLYSIPRSHLPQIQECCLSTDHTAVRDTIAREGLDNALIFVKSPFYRDYGQTLVGDYYGYAFALNQPNLQGPIVCARDLGKRNAELIAQYPDRSAYRIIPGKFGGHSTLEKITAQTAASKPSH